MNWRTIGQMAVAAVVGAGIFEAGRIAAFREMLHADEAALSEMPDGGAAERPKLIAEQVVRPVPVSVEPEEPVAKPQQVEFTRKKYADPPLAAPDVEFIGATETAVERGDYQAARQLGREATKSARAEVRAAAVRMLAWFGKLGIAELTPYLADGDDGVALEASAEWKRIFANECSDRDRLEVAALVMNRLTSEKMLDELGVEDIFDEVEDETAAVESLIGIIRTGNPAGVKVAKSAYDTVTGEEWKDEDAARKWIRENADDAS